MEQETFESKRQNKLRKQFQKDEVDIITNIYWSLVIRAKKVQFEPNSSKVDGKYFDVLARIKDALMLYPNRKISIEGHTDSSGDAKTNRKLSLQRAEAVRKFLTAAGMSASRIRALGFGEAKPIASNMYKKGRAMNRRIDIVIGAPRG
ncbi:MAG: OmpA family protein [Ghiorsea sp.]|nr:OmpA family protein [Ghiorsea sp.]